MTDTLSIPQEALEAAQKPRSRPADPGQPITYAIDTGSRAYAVAALRSEAEIVASAPEGQRNPAINKGVYSVAGYIGKDLLTEQEVRDAFTWAAKKNGEWDDRADGVIADLIDRAIKAGRDNPRPIPESPEPSVVLYAVDDTDEWPAMQPLPEAAEPPELPAEMLPEPFAEWITYISESLNAPLASPAAAALVAAGGTLGRAVAVQPKELDTTWAVTPNVWGADIDHPGSKKSARMGAAFNPLRALDREAGDAFEQDEMLRESNRIAIKGRIEVLTAELRKGQATGKGRKTEAELEEIRADLQAALQEQADLPTGAPRIIVTDSTTQALGEIHRSNPRGLLLLRDELSGFLNTFNRQGREGDREFYLEAWNGNGTYTWDTISRGTTRVKNLCISVYGGIQPGKLRQHIEDAVDGDADGLLQRFQLMTYPARRKKYERHDQAPPQGLLNRVQETFRRLRNAPEKLRGSDTSD